MGQLYLRGWAGRTTPGLVQPSLILATKVRQASIVRQEP